MALYWMEPPKLKELRKQLKDFLESGHICLSKAPFEAPSLFQKKKDGTLRLCLNYRTLYKVMVINKYPIPLIANLFDRLGQAKVFTKMYLGKVYYQVCIVEGDEPKMNCMARYGSFEWLVMLFGLTNDLAIFCKLMNNLFQHYLVRFIVIYLDDIIVYKIHIEEQVKYLQLVFSVLR